MAEPPPEHHGEDADRFRRWEDQWADMAPMTQEAIDAVAVVFRRIDERRAVDTSKDS